MLYITLATSRSPPFSKAVGREPAWNFYGDKEVEIIDPASDPSHLIAPMNCARFKFPNSVTIAGNVKVIVGGGGRRVEVYDYNANRFVVSGSSVED